MSDKDEYSAASSLSTGTPTEVVVPVKSALGSATIRNALYAALAGAFGALVPLSSDLGFALATIVTQFTPAWAAPFIITFILSKLGGVLSGVSAFFAVRAAIKRKENDDIQGIIKVPQK